jgi:hypothetical protein
MVDTGDFVADLEKKNRKAADCEKAERAIEAEILRRFRELEEKAQTAEIGGPHFIVTQTGFRPVG